MIDELLTGPDGGLSVKNLCAVSGVSRSGYYRWSSRAPDRAQRDKTDYEQHLLIKDVFQRKNGKAGWRVIKMSLERQGTIMNHKKIRRLMKKYGLVTRIRRSNPYKRLAKATQEHRTVPNVLGRRFDQVAPYKAFGTDITYLYDGHGQRWYLSIIKDLATAEIVAHRVSASPGLELSLEAISQAITRIGRKKLGGALIHSDQGFHYTHPLYVRRLAELGMVQSMSRKGNCLDNAPVESFFGHMKDELDLTQCHSSYRVRATVDEYVYDYNHHRYQWERKKMAPVEYRDHLLAG
ncbi:MAG: IS3 family transposase [Bacillota bacterium]